jgi:O-antigen/teichoic acid export membrane protein
MNRTKNISIIGLSDIIGSAISAIFWFYLATLLSPEGYGKIFYFLGLAGLVSSISSVGAQSVVTVYTAKRIQVNSEIYFITLSITSTAAIVMILFTQRVDVGLLMLGYVVFNLTVGQVLGERNYKKYAYFSLLQKSLALVCGLTFYFTYGIEFVIYGLALSYVFHMYVILKKIKFREFNFNELRRRWKFVFSNYINNLSNGFNGQIDKLVIAPFFGFTILGNYSLAVQVILVLLTIPNIAYKYLLSEELAKTDNKKFKKQICVIAGFLTIIGISITPMIIPTLFPMYIDSIESIMIMSLAILPMTLSKIYLVNLLKHEKGFLVLSGTLISITGFILGIIILGGVFGSIGIAITFVVSLVSQMIFFYVADRTIAKKTTIS